MKSGLRFPALGVRLAFMFALVVAPARADRRNARIAAPSHGAGLAPPTDGRGHDGAELEGLVTAVDTTAPGTISLTDDELGPVDVTLQDTTIIRHGGTAMTL